MHSKILVLRFPKTEVQKPIVCNLARNYDLSKTIGTPMIQRLDASGADFGVTDCPTCQMQMEHLGNKPIRHPVEIIRQAMADRALI